MKTCARNKSKVEFSESTRCKLAKDMRSGNGKENKIQTRQLKKQQSGAHSEFNCGLLDHKSSEFYKL